MSRVKTNADRIPSGHWRAHGEIVPISEMDDFHLFSAIMYLEAIFPRYKELVQELTSRRLKSLKAQYKKRRR